MIAWINRVQDLFENYRKVDFLAPLALRVYLIPVFWVVGYTKLAHFSDVATYYFGQQLGLPFPTLMTFLAISAEIGGVVCLTLGFATRWATIPLMFTMIVAAATVHWQHGWQAVHDLQSPYPSEHAVGALDRLSRAKDILQEHGNYDWLTEHGNFIVSNNGIEWAATYFLMLLALFFLGGGRYVSLDYWLAKRFRTQNDKGQVNENRNI